MNEFLEELKTYRDYQNAVELDSVTDDKERREWVKFAIKCLQYYKFCKLWKPLDLGRQLEGENPFFVFDDFILCRPTYQMIKVCRKTKSIFNHYVWDSEFQWSYDYYKFLSTNSRLNIDDYFHDVDYMINEIDQKWDSGNPKFQYEVSPRFIAASQMIWNELKVEVESALVNKISRIETRNIEVEFV
jgi:hypothetical protein